MILSQIITLTTDFGLADSYVAQLKGVILSLCSSVCLVDLSHTIPQHDIQSAARLLADAVPCYPEKTIHLSVVDPGVGTARRRLIIQGRLSSASDDTVRDTTFVGPDNGLFSLVLAQAVSFRVWEIELLEKLPRIKKNKGPTFDGRDIFAPTAALLAAGCSPEYFGREIDQTVSPLITISLPQPVEQNGERSEGEILYFDSFGNAVTNLSVRESTDLKITLLSFGTEVTVVRSYQEIPEQGIGALINSEGKLELAARRESAQKRFKLQVGDKVRLERIYRNR